MKTSMLKNAQENQITACKKQRSSMIELNHDTKEFCVKHNGLTLIIDTETFPANPRDEHGVTKLLLWGHNEFVGDKNPYTTIPDIEQLKNKEDIFFIYPVFLNNDTHTLSANIDLDCDCRHIGYIYMTKADAELEYYDHESTELCEDRLLKDIMEYSQYINGDVYGFTIYLTNEDSDDEVVDGGGNYYPRDNFLDTIKEMSNSCDDEYYHLFEMLINEIESSSSNAGKLSEPYMG